MKSDYYPNSWCPAEVNGKAKTFVEEQMESGYCGESEIRIEDVYYFFDELSESTLGKIREDLNRQKTKE